MPLAVFFSLKIALAILSLLWFHKIFRIAVLVQLLSCVRLFATSWTAACQASLSLTVSQRLLKLMCTESVMPSNHLNLCRLLLFLPSISPSIRVFSSDLALHLQWPKYWSFSFRISPSNEYSGLISFRIDWFDLFAVQGTPATQFEIISSSAFNLLYGPVLTSAYMTTGKIIALTIWTIVSKVMSLLFNTLSRFVVAFLPRSKSFNFMAVVTIWSVLGAQENKICHCSTFPLQFAMK